MGKGSNRCPGGDGAGINARLGKGSRGNSSASVAPQRFGSACRALAKKEQRDSPLPREETLRRFGEHGYRIAVAENRIVALAAWEAENLVASVREIWTESVEVAEAALPKLLELIENEARELLCEVVLLLIPPVAPVDIAVQAHLAGYEIQDFDALHKLWQQAIYERMKTGDQIWGKVLRAELVTKPF